MMNILLTYNIETWGEKLKDLLLMIIIPIAAGVLAWNLIPLIFKRAWAQIITTALAGGLALYLVADPNVMKGIGQAIITFLMGSK